MQDDEKKRFATNEPRGSGTRNPRRERAASEETRRRIQAAAERLFARQGYGATGMRQIAREAEVNLATIAYFFESKAGLLRAILDDYFDGFTATLRANLPGDAPLEDRLRRTIHAGVDYFAAHRDQLLIVIPELNRDMPEITELKVRRVREIARVFWGEVIEPLAAAGRAVPPYVVAPALMLLTASRFLLAPVLEPIAAELSGGGAPAINDHEYADAIATLYLEGLTGLMGRGPAGGAA